MIGSMVIRFAYREEHYATVDGFDRGVETLINLGWRISEATGPDNGPFAVLFRMDEKREGASAKSCDTRLAVLTRLPLKGGPVVNRVGPQGQRRNDMAFSIACKDSGMNCPGAFTTETESELMEHVEIHAKNSHPEMKLDVATRDHIKEMVKTS